MLPGEWRGVTRALVAWDAAVLFYLIVAMRLMSDCDVVQIRRRAAMQDEGRYAIPLLVVAAALASLGAIVVELNGVKGSARDGSTLALASATVLLSWALIHVIFALHYAHTYYDADAHRGGGLNFPGDTPPDYWDFVYFSLVVGMTSQVSDVAVSSPKLRRMVAAHGLVSFVYNLMLIALTVNIAASALTGAGS
jgi:uncharacterized membrane protein